ncbi:MAG: DUF1566 domain-containing protein [Wenzhouxiangella sp.]
MKLDTAMRRTAAAALVLILAACGNAPDGPPVSDSWVRVDARGGTLPADERTGHHCVLDRSSGLMWEVKRDAPGLHHFGHTYTWYSDDRERHMSEPGQADGGLCEGSPCDTRAFVDAVNAAGLCGHDDWRLPGREELMSLGDKRLRASGMIVDAEFFPHVLAEEYWTFETFRLYPQSAWAVSMKNGLDRADRKTEAKAVRLVRRHRDEQGD